MSLPARRSRSGLTILELLVSVSVITLLAGLLLPAVLHARAAARTACQSNLKQWALAVHLYADIHDAQLPYRGEGMMPTTHFVQPNDWFNALPRLVDEPTYAELATRAQKPHVRQWIYIATHPRQRYDGK